MTSQENLLTNDYIEGQIPRFYGNARVRIGKQNFKNQFEPLNDIDFEWTYGLPDGMIRTKLKKFLNMATPGVEVVFPLFKPPFSTSYCPIRALHNSCHGTHSLINH